MSAIPPLSRQLLDWFVPPLAIPVAVVIVLLIVVATS